MPFKARHSPSHSTDCNWTPLLPPTGPSQSGVLYIEYRSVSNSGSRHREFSALPTELRDTLFMVSARGNLFLILGIITTFAIADTMTSSPSLSSRTFCYLIYCSPWAPQKLACLRCRCSCAQGLEHGVSAIVFSSVTRHALTLPRVSLAFIISRESTSGVTNLIAYIDKAPKHLEPIPPCTCM